MISKSDLNRIQVAEMKYLVIIEGHTRADHKRNKNIRKDLKTFSVRKKQCFIQKNIKNMSSQWKERIILAFHC